MSSERETTQHIKFRVLLYILIVIIYEQSCTKQHNML